ncbi:Methyl-CpG-binding domain-containing protein 9 [Platanthera zijinensis]|uniref:Methyl-CpG-binding domain-containing protein 9 n=1 Tax=Platanthera zijinensis TaxID=2320716 RepID=A0AAP0G545_9ASPA
MPLPVIPMPVIPLPSLPALTPPAPALSFPYGHLTASFSASFLARPRLAAPTGHNVASSVGPCSGDPDGPISVAGRRLSALPAADAAHHRSTDHAETNSFSARLFATTATRQHSRYTEEPTIHMEIKLPEEPTIHMEFELGDKLDVKDGWIDTDPQSVILVQATVLFEDMIKTDYLKNGWWYWSSLTAASRTPSISALALRVYALDDSIIYFKDPAESLDPDSQQLITRVGRKRKDMEVGS